MQAYFQNIRVHLKDELQNSSSSIYVAVAWLTDKQLFNILCRKAKEGVNVQLIVVDDEINRSCSINYCDLECAGGKLFLVEKTSGVLMHHKFCVIDENVVITGSYNWSIKATGNHENITVIKDDSQLAHSFIDEFKKIKELYFGNRALLKLDYSILHNRLKVIECLMSLEDYTYIQIHYEKLEEFDLPESITEIIEELKIKNWSYAENLIKNYLKLNQTVKVFEDVTTEELKWKIKYFELEIIALESEKLAMKKIVSDFMHNYTLKFGEILSRILELKKDKLKAKGSDRFKDFKAAEDKYDQFRQEYKREKALEKDYNHLDSEGREVLRKKYRKAASLCHPDAVANRFPNNPEMLAKAEELFKKLNEAHTKNDLNTVSEILKNLEIGVFDFNNIAQISSTKEFLEARILELKKKLETIQAELRELRNNKDYMNIINIKDFELFYKEEEIKLLKELKDLENE